MLAEAMSVTPVKDAYASVGLELAAGARINGYAYNPETRRVWTPGRAEDPRSLHDLAHYIVSSPEARELPNFGLGPDYTVETGHMALDGTQRRSYPTLPRNSSEWQYQELRACVMHQVLVDTLFENSTDETLKDLNVSRKEALSVYWTLERWGVALDGRWTGEVRA